MNKQHPKGNKEKLNMKKLIFLGLLFMGAVSAGSVYESYYLFNEVMASGENILSVLKTRHMEIVKVDVGSVGLSTKECVYKDLSIGYSYFISMAGQRSRIANLHARVYFVDPKGTETFIALDTVGNYPNIKITPTRSGTYKIVVSVASMVKGCEGNGYYFLAIGAIKL
jgi:hypothetical protein